MTTGAFRHLGDEVVHEGAVWRLTTSSFDGPDGRSFVRDVVRSPGAVAVVPLMFDAEGHPSVVLVDQYRPPFDASVIEIPAGLRDVEDEPRETTALRELREEVGLSAGRIEHLVDIYPSPGMTDAVTSIFLALECTSVDADRHGPEEEAMEVLHLPLEDAVSMIDDGRIHDAKTVAALLLLERRLLRSS